MLRDIATAFVMKGLTQKPEVYQNAVSTQDAEFDLIQDITDLVISDLTYYLNTETKGVLIDTKVELVCESVGRILIQIIYETGNLPSENEWHLIFDSLKQRVIYAKERPLLVGELRRL